MQDIKDAEVDSVRDLTSFLDAELDFHERCAEELRRVRRSWAGAAMSPPSRSGREPGRSRSNTAHSYNDRLSRTNSNTTYQEEPEPEPVRLPIRSNSRVNNGGHEMPARPPIGRASTFQGGSVSDRMRSSGSGTPAYGQNGSNVSALRAGLRPVNRIQTNTANVFSDDADDTASESTSPEYWGERSASPATSYSSLSRSTSALSAGGLGTRKAPPPPPPSRSKKPAPPIPAKRDLGY